MSSAWIIYRVTLTCIICQCIPWNLAHFIQIKIDWSQRSLLRRLFRFFTCVCRVAKDISLCENCRFSSWTYVDAGKMQIRACVCLWSWDLPSRDVLRPSRPVFFLSLFFFFFLYPLSWNRPSFLFELFRERSLVAREDEFPRVQIVVKLTVSVKVNVNLMYARGTSELTIREFLRSIDVNLVVLRFRTFPHTAFLQCL